MIKKAGPPALAMQKVLRAGVVALIGRPNTGKSTLLNNLLKQKVSITSPKPQTTRFSIQAVYEDDRGQIIFVDTPGIFAKVKDALSKKINLSAEKALAEEVNIIVYLVDHTRYRDIEENKTLGIIRKVEVPKILVINKIDVKSPSYKEQYVFLEDEFDEKVEISALKRTNLNILLDLIYQLLPVGNPIVKPENQGTPALNIDSRTFIAELIREKAFLNLHKELPYTITTKVDQITERGNGNLYIKGKIITSNDRYKGMIIGKNGKMIREIGMALRKELEVSTGKKVFVDLTVEVNPHWIEQMM